MNLTINQIKALDLNRNLAVTAGAGSGKTTILVKRYLHILLNNPHLNVSNVLAITFTEKAAAEMKDRIFQEVNQEFLKDNVQKERLFEIMNQMQDARIQTIHAFCSHLLHQYPVEVGINPDFTVLDSLQTEELLNQTFRDFFIDYEVEGHPQQENILTTLRELSPRRVKNIFFNIYHSRSIIFPFLMNLPVNSPPDVKQLWEEQFESYHALILSPLLENKKFWEGISELTEIEISGNEKEVQRQKLLADYLGEIQTNANPNKHVYQTIIPIIDLLTKKDKGAYSRIPGGEKCWGTIGVERFRQLSETAAGYSGQLIPFEEETEDHYAKVFVGLREVLLEYLSRVEKTKTRQNALDFDDLQLGVLKLLQSRPEICDQLRERYPFILIDEFQDTDHLQSEIIRFISHDQLGKLDRNRLFIVGDPKQSIFGFRNADVSIFENYMNEFASEQQEAERFQIEGYDEDLQITPENLQGIIPLSENFRSSKVLIQFFNRSFEPIFKKETQYDAEFQTLSAQKSGASEQNSQINLDLFYDQSEEGLDTENLQSNKIAEQIQTIVDSDEYRKLVTTAEQNRLEKLSYGDIAVLIRSRNSLSKLESTFRERDIPYQTYKGSGFFQRQEIQDLYYMLSAVADPDNDFAFVTFLRSSYLALSDVCLLYLKQVVGTTYWGKLTRFSKWLRDEVAAEETFHPKFYDFMKKNHHSINLDAGERDTILKLIEEFSEWHELALRGSFSQLLDKLVEDLNIRAVMNIQQDGSQKVANLDKFIHYIFEFEQSNSGLLSELLDILQQQITGQMMEGEGVIMAEDEDKVKIITYHSAKGMEFPVVFLPFLEKSFRYNSQLIMDKNWGPAFSLERSVTRDDAQPFAYEFLRTLDKEKTLAEEKRLFYVASTRAQDHLFLLGSVDKKGNIGNPSTLSWFLSAYGKEELSPVHKTEQINIGEQYTFTIQHRVVEEMPEMFEKKQVLKSGEINFQDIFDTESVRLQTPVPEAPGGQVYSATQLMLFQENKERYFRHFYLNDGQIFPPQVDLEFIDEPGGAMWGTTVHKLLEDFHLRKPEGDEQKIRQLMLQMNLMKEGDQEVLKIKLNELMQRVRKSELNTLLSKGKQLSEYAVNLKIEDFILRGIFDRMFQNEVGFWEVLDFKTNHIKSEEVTQTAQKYHFQLKAYALILSGLFPNQETFPITLYFLVPMQAVRKTFEIAELKRFREQIIQLMYELFEKESRIFS